MNRPIPFIGLALHSLLVGCVRSPASDWMIIACLVIAADKGSLS
jgi:hypothetical protein